MRLRLGTFSRYRPRVLTVVVLAVVAAPIVMSNLTYDESWREREWSTGELRDKSYGWPLIWHRYVSVYTSDHQGEIGWYYSVSRLAANLAMWLAMLTAPAAACEWLVRRYRPRLRWSLRTMLVAVGLAAALLAWFAAARERAKHQDPLIAEINGRAGYVSLERWGPRWLSLIGADCYRRQFIFAAVPIDASKFEDMRLLKRLSRLPKLQHLKVDVDCLTPSIANAISGLHQLRSLSIRESGKGGDHHEQTWREILAAIQKMTWLDFMHMELPARRGKQLALLQMITNLKSLRIDGSYAYDENFSHDCLQAIGQLSELEFLGLCWMQSRAESVACLDGLGKLKQLELNFVHSRESTLLDRLPPLPRLRTIDVSVSDVGDQDLRRLARLPQLRALGLDVKEVTPAGLREFMATSSVEELALEDNSASADALESLLVSKRLRTLHVSRFTEWSGISPEHGEGEAVLTQEFNRCRQALQALRQLHPEIVIDGDTSAITADWQSRSASSYDPDPDRWHDVTWLPGPSMPWMTPAERADFEQAGGWASFDGAGFRDGDGSTYTIRY